MSVPVNSYIVFQAYGHEGILHECAFALLTLCRQHKREELKDLEVCIYTDNPGFFRSFKDCWLNPNFREIDQNLIRQWKGAIDFVHRVKIEILRDFTKDSTGQVLYLDTDVCFDRPVTEMFHNIAEGKLYMHLMEGLVHKGETVINAKVSAYVKKNAPLLVNGKQVNIPEEATMWNAGVLGFHTKHKHLLDEVLAFTDAIYQEFPKHIVEQFAFSSYFQQAAPLLSAHTYIFHYWNLKEIRFIFSSFFQYFKDSDWTELVRYSILIQLPVPMQEKVNFLQNRTPLAKFMKKQWQPSTPRWDLLIQQL
jgi:hypothetical protein